MTRAVPRVRYIKPETIVLDDLIRITTKRDGIETTRMGRAVTRDHEGSSTVYRTAEGGELLRYIPANSVDFTVTLIEPSSRRFAAQAPLFTM